MTRRMIDSSIWYKESFVQLPPTGRLLQIGMINYADDQGRLVATPFHLKGHILPGDDVALAEIQAWLEQMHSNGTIILYVVDNRQYAQFVNWWDYQSLQYAQPSKFPKPEGWIDRIRRTATKGQIVTFNWHTVDNTKLPDSCDCAGNPLPKVAKPHSNGGDPQTPARPPSPDGRPTAQQSGAVSPAHSGESTPERITITELELEEEPTGEYNDYESTAQAAVSAKPTPPPSQPTKPFVTKPNEYLPGLPDPRLRQNGHTQLNERVLEAQSLGVKPELFRLLCDEFLNGFGRRARAYAEEDGCTLNDAQKRTLELIHMSALFRVRGGIERIFQSWRENDYRGDTPPSTNQFMDHASLMSDNRVVSTRKANTNGTFSNGNGKPAPQFGILARGAQDRERVAAHKPTPEEIERGRAELRAHRAAVSARKAAGEPDLILERIKQQIALERSQGIPPS